MITKHGSERVNRRMGIPKKGVERQFKLALERGVKHGETKGQLNKWVTKIALNSQSPHHVVLYNGHAFVYAIKGGEPLLITVLPIPSNLMKGVKRG